MNLQQKNTIRRNLLGQMIGEVIRFLFGITRYCFEGLTTIGSPMLFIDRQTHVASSANYGWTARGRENTMQFLHFATGTKMDAFIFHQDPVEELLKIFDGAFRLVVPGPGRKIVELKSISEKQDGLLGWYMWFDDYPGAYLFELAGAEAKGTKSKLPMSSRRAVQGVFSIKYYPDITDILSLSFFSAAEQNMRQGVCFDNTGTPDFEKGGEIPPLFFQIGTIEVGIQAESEKFTLHLSVPDQWLVPTTEANSLHQQPEMFEKRDCSNPAWNWSWFLMDRLILILCLAYSTKPEWVALHGKPKYSPRTRENDNLLIPPDLGDYQLQHLSISFSLHGEHELCSDSLGEHTSDPLWAFAMPPVECLLSLCREPVEPVPWVSSAWWHVRAKPLNYASVLPC